jgi:tripeptide aminopeptidase
MTEQSPVYKFFMTIASMDSYIGREGKLADYLEEKLRGLDAEVSRDDSAAKTGSDTGNIIARFPGTIPSAPTILLCSHMDTIGPTGDMVPVVRDGIIYSNGETVLGADDKAGIAVIVSTIEHMQEQGIAHGPLEVVFTVQEEPGLRGATHLSADLKADFGYILDGDGVVGTIINCAPAKIDLDFTMLGQAAHAGICPEDGVNAVVAASSAVSRIHSGRIDSETTSNFGMFKGGTLRNIVADRAEVAVEVRSADDAKLEGESDKVIEAFESSAREFGAELEFTKNYAFKSFDVPLDHPAVVRARAAAESLGIEPVMWASGGGLDANVFNGRGLTCVALGLGIEEPHSSSEYIPVAQLEEGVRFLTAVLSRSAD